MKENQKAEVEGIAKRFNVGVDFVEAGLEARYATTMRAKLEAFNKERKLIVQDSEAIQKQHEKGKWTARERVGKLLDLNSFDELDLWHRPYETGFDIGEEKGRGDGVVIGYGTVGNRSVTLWAQDATVLGGTVGAVHARKVTMIMENGLKNRTPVVALFDSEGIRAEDAVQYPDFYSASSMAYFQTLSLGGRSQGIPGHGLLHRRAFPRRGPRGFHLHGARHKLHARHASVPVERERPDRRCLGARQRDGGLRRPRGERRGLPAKMPPAPELPSLAQRRISPRGGHRG